MPGVLLPNALGLPGGGLSYALATDGGCRYERGHAKAEPASALTLADGVRIVRYRVPVEATALLNERTGTVFEMPPEFEPLLELLDGRRAVADLAAAFTLSSRGDGALGSFTRDVLLESLPRLLDGLVQQGFLAPTNVGA